MGGGEIVFTRVDLAENRSGGMLLHHLIIDTNLQAGVEV